MLRRPFLDFESGLLIIDSKNLDPESQRRVGVMTFYETKIHVVDLTTLQELTPEQWAVHFDYEPSRSVSPDGRFELVEQRILGDDGKGDSIESELFDAATGESRATSDGVAFQSKKRRNLLDGVLELEDQQAKRDQDLEDQIRAGNAQRCAHCDTPVHRNVRYPDHLCTACAALEKVDEQGRKVTFTNASMSGGLIIYRWADGEVISEDSSKQQFVCLIEGKRYVAREARIGGVVLSPENDSP